MSKFDEQFKLKVVKEYLSGTVGYKSVAQRNGLSYSLIKRWVHFYQQHGVAGLAKKKIIHYNADFKMSVLQHMWDHELSLTQVAALFNIRNAANVSNWERCYHDGGIDALIPLSRHPNRMSDSTRPKPSLLTNDKTSTREVLLAEVLQLRMEVAYLKKLRALVQSQKQERATARKKCKL
jgi:transposase